MADLIYIPNKIQYAINGLGAVKSNILIGGSLPEKFVPNVNVSYSCFSGKEKFFLNLNRRSIDIVDQKESVQDGQVSIVTGNETDIFYTVEDKFKWDIQFKIKPANLILEWDLLHSEGVYFFYQDTLENEYLRYKDGCDSLDEYLDVHHRPDDIVGSYAVFCNRKNALRAKNRSYIVNYFAGKLGHITRPFVLDSQGKRAWCVLNISENKLRISLPSTFMENASYPVRLDPVLGYDNIGGTLYGTDGIAKASLLNVDNSAQVAPSNGGPTTDVYFYLDDQGGSDWDKEVDAGIYNDSGGSPNNVLDSTTKTSSFISPGWNFVTVNVQIVSGNTYYPAFAWAFGNGNARYDGVPTQASGHKTGAPTLPDPWNGSSSPFAFSNYLSYVEAGGNAPTGTINGPLVGPLGGPI